VAGLKGFEELPLHDAVPRSVEANWEKKHCRLHLSVFLIRGGDATPHVLMFEGVTCLSVAHDEPLGALIVRKLGVQCR
jgi:hypothetical protein